MNDQKQKKVAVVLNEMSIGGIPKACASFVNQLSTFCDVTMIMCNLQGEFTYQLSRSVNFTVVPSIGISDVLKKYWCKKRYIKLIGLGVCYLKSAYLEKRWVKVSEMIFKEKEMVDSETYDCAIAYHGMNITHLVRTLYQVNAKKKIAWIHGEHPFEGIHRKDVAKVYRQFDMIYCVSEMTRQRFLKDFPNVTDITEVYYNLLETKDIVEKSQLYIPNEFDCDKINLVTVGRVSREKGQEMIPYIMNLLLKYSEKIHWYIVGEGDDRSRVQQLTREKELEERIHFIGAKDNPYPYMLNCDIYVQPSYTEAYGLTIFEAAILGKAIVATDVGGAKEHLSNDKEIVLVEATPEAIAKGVEQLLLNSDKKKEIENNLKDRDFSNKTEINKLLSLLGI